MVTEVPVRDNFWVDYHLVTRNCLSPSSSTMYLLFSGLELIGGPNCSTGGVFGFVQSLAVREEKLTWGHAFGTVSDGVRIVPHMLILSDLAPDDSVSLQPAFVGIVMTWSCHTIALRILCFTTLVPTPSGRSSYRQTHGARPANSCPMAHSCKLVVISMGLG